MNASKRFQLAVLIFGAVGIMMSAVQNDGVLSIHLLVVYGILTLIFALE